MRTPKLTDRIQVYLRQHPGTGAGEISADLDADPSHVAAVLQRLSRRGRARRETAKPKCYGRF
jgi:DNA-binding MarR family transcriptional regulator